MSRLRPIDEHSRVLRAARAVAASLVVAAVIRQLSIVADHPTASPIDLFSFFTIQSNCLAAAVWAAGAWKPSWAARHQVLRGACTTYLIIVASVYIVLSFGPGKEEYLQLTAWWVDMITHQILPVAIVVEWVLVPPRQSIRARVALAWLLYPIVFFVLTMIRGWFSGWYPYAFLQPGYWGGYSGVFLNALIVLAIMTPIALAVAAIGSRRARAWPPRPQTTAAAPAHPLSGERAGKRV